jgi:23S rRNA pseudouridine1911/1915/1917 synthase
MSGCFSLWPAPRVIDETGGYAVLYKPPLMFSAPLSDDPAGTLLGWFATRCPAVLKAAAGREGGLLHRLDFETEGLILLAKTPEALESLRAQQKAGAFVKEYCALGYPSPETGGPGFPALPPPFAGEGPLPLKTPLTIESFFRPWGPGRKTVRPLTGGRPLSGKARRKIARDGAGPYRTELLAVDGPVHAGPGGPPGLFTLRIRRGFRHQIRCHLAWIGRPILNDVLYGGRSCPEDCPTLRPCGPVKPGGREKRPVIALRARGIRFLDPATGEPRDYLLPGFMSPSCPWA